MKQLILKIVSGFIILTYNSCIEDNITPPLTGALDPVAEMLIYFEANGDFVNSLSAPALATAEEVFSNPGSFLIVDVRNNSEYLNGHIEGAVNISIDSLYDFIKSIEIHNYQKIILVSKNGQSSSYFTCLLRLAGVNNVYSMKYGMTSWNMNFAEDWITAIGDHPNILTFTNDITSKNILTALPGITFSNPDASFGDRVQERIKQIIREGFQYSTVLPSAIGNYIICYGNGTLYFARNNYPLAGSGHQAGTVSYLDSPFFEFRSVNYLQTLPVDQPIAIYDYDGQMSACMAAYLRVLGYNARSILFGGNQLFYSRMLEDPDLKPFVFSTSEINNYPYVTGE